MKNKRCSTLLDLMDLKVKQATTLKESLRMNVAHVEYPFCSTAIAFHQIICAHVTGD